mgnify:CR=1 FL=1
MSEEERKIQYLKLVIGMMAAVITWVFLALINNKLKEILEVFSTFANL